MHAGSGRDRPGDTQSRAALLSGKAPGMPRPPVPAAPEPAPEPALTFGDPPPLPASLEQPLFDNHALLASRARAGGVQAGLVGGAGVAFSPAAGGAGALALLPRAAAAAAPATPLPAQRPPTADRAPGSGAPGTSWAAVAAGRRADPVGVPPRAPLAPGAATPGSSAAPVPLPHLLFGTSPFGRSVDMVDVCCQLMEAGRATAAVDPLNLGSLRAELEATPHGPGGRRPSSAVVATPRPPLPATAPRAAPARPASWEDDDDDALMGMSPDGPRVSTALFAAAGGAGAVAAALAPAPFAPGVPAFRATAWVQGQMIDQA